MFFLSLRDPGDSVRVSGIFLYDCPPPSIAPQSRDDLHGRSAAGLLLRLKVP